MSLCMKLRAGVQMGIFKAPGICLKLQAGQSCLRPQPRPSDGPRTAPCVGPVLKERPTAPSSRRRVAAVGGAGARIKELGSDYLDPDVYPTAEPCSNASLQRPMSPFAIYTLYLLCSGLNNEDGRQSAPLAEAMYCTSTRRASSRCAGETGTRTRTNTNPYGTEASAAGRSGRACVARAVSVEGGGTVTKALYCASVRCASSRCLRTPCKM